MARMASETVINPTAAKAPGINNSIITMKRILLPLGCILASIGCCGGPMFLRFYFLHGGKSVWLSSWLQTAGWPLTLIPLTISYLRRRRRRSANPKTEVFYTRPFVFFAAASIGALIGVDNYLYAYGVSRLPVSTSSLVFASQLAFTAAFAFLLVRQKFTPFSINSVVLLTLGAGMLALRASSDRPQNETNNQYILGFIMTLAASLLNGLILPLIELTYMKAKKEITYTLVMEIQLINGLFATIVCTTGMILNNDFEAVAGEARKFWLGEAKFYLLLLCSMVIWQCLYTGLVAVIFCGSSFLSGVVIAALLPVTEVLAVVFYKEKFSGEKGVALALSLWGSVSYFYGEARQDMTRKQSTSLVPETELPFQNNNVICDSVANTV